MEKIRTRQQANLQELGKKQQEKLTRLANGLNEKIYHARENRQHEIRVVKQKAQNDIQTVEDIKYIMKMQQLNNELTYTNKLNETQERRNLKIKEKLEKLDDFKQREHEVHRKRLKMLALRRSRLQLVEDKGKLALQKRKDQNDEKKQKAK